jgi:hypothetical protein
MRLIGWDEIKGFHFYSFIAADPIYVSPLTIVFIEQLISRSPSQEYNALMEPKGSLLCLQGPITGPYPEPDESTPHLHTLFLWDPFECLAYPAVYTYTFQMIHSLQDFLLKFCIFLMSHMRVTSCYISSP